MIKYTYELDMEKFMLRITTYSKYLFAILIAIFIHIPLSPATAELKLLTETYPPFNFENDQGKASGISTEILQVALKRARITYSITFRPWKRAYMTTLSEGDTCLYSTAQTEDRKNLFKWVGPLIENDWVLFANAESDLNIQSIEDIKDLRIGGYPEDAITEHLLSLGFDVEVTGTDLSNLRKLRGDRIDLWPSGLVVGSVLSAKEGISVKPVFSIKKVAVSLACNKSVSDITIMTLQTILDEMREDGSIDVIKAQYNDQFKPQIKENANQS